MSTYLGTNTFFLSVLLPVFILALVGIVWLVVRAHVTPWKKIGLAIGGLFALLGFYGAVLCVYYKTNANFAGTFRFYAYSALAPAGNPFETPNNDYRQALVLREVVNKDGVISFLKHPNPNYPTTVAVFAPGKFIEADLNNDTLTVPPPPQDSTGVVTHTSLWWALTKNLSNLISRVE